MRSFFFALSMYIGLDRLNTALLGLVAISSIRPVPSSAVMIRDGLTSRVPISAVLRILSSVLRLSFLLLTMIFSPSINRCIDQAASAHDVVLVKRCAKKSRHHGVSFCNKRMLHHCNVLIIVLISAMIVAAEFYS